MSPLCPPPAGTHRLPAWESQGLCSTLCYSALRLVCAVQHMCALPPIVFGFHVLANTLDCASLHVSFTPFGLLSVVGGESSWNPTGFQRVEYTHWNPTGIQVWNPLTGIHLPCYTCAGAVASRSSLLQSTY